VKFSCRRSLPGWPEKLLGRAKKGATCEGKNVQIAKIFQHSDTRLRVGIFESLGSGIAPRVGAGFSLPCSLLEERHTSKEKEISHGRVLWQAH
jgi:hypothetical protein